MTIYKKCITCHSLFPSELKNPNSFCPEHQDVWRKWVLTLIKSRSVNASNFNVYNKEGKKVCRVCGDPLPNQHYTSCKKCDQMELLLKKWSWSSVRANFVREHQKEKGLNLCKVQCDGCVETIEDDLKEMTTPWQVHHKIPVHTLDHENFRLVWDVNNLIILCRKCHGKDHRKIPLENFTIKYKTLEEWMK